MRGLADSVDPARDRLGDLVEGVGGQVGQLRALQVRPQRLDRL